MMERPSPRSGRRRSVGVYVGIATLAILGIGAAYRIWRSSMQSLMFDATWYGTPETMRSYLNLGLDPNAYEYERARTVFHHALSGRRIEMIRLLLDHGGDPDRVGRGDVNLSNAFRESPQIVILLRAGEAGRRLLRDYGVP